jgi:hypothetical protein
LIMSSFFCQAVWTDKTWKNGAPFNNRVPFPKRYRKTEIKQSKF